MIESNKPARLSRSTREVITALADTIIPSGEPGRPGATDMDLTDRLIEWLGEIPGAVNGFIAVAWCWEFAPIWSGKFARFSRLSFEDRTWVLEQWEESRLSARRWALFGIKALFMASFYNNPALWPHLGYKEGCLSKPPNALES